MRFAPGGQLAAAVMRLEKLPLWGDLAEVKSDTPAHLAQKLSKQEPVVTL
jgi:hypothetical protein